MLHIHHEGEDELLYPKLIERVPERAPMTEEVEHEHEMIRTALDAAAARCTAWRQAPSSETATDLAAALDELSSETRAPPRRRGGEGRPARRGDADAAGVERHR
jgi:hypothetical protein